MHNEAKEKAEELKPKIAARSEQLSALLAESDKVLVDYDKHTVEMVQRIQKTRDEQVL